MSKIVMSSMKDVEMYLGLIAENTVAHSMEAIKKSWEDNMKAYFYNAYNPVMYQRTYAMLDSIAIGSPVSSSQGATGVVYMDFSSDYFLTRYSDVQQANAREFWALAMSGYHGNTSISTSPDYPTMMKAEIKDMQFIREIANKVEKDLNIKIIIR